MRVFKDPRLILGIIISLTLFSAELNSLYPTTLQDRLKQGKTINLLLIGIDARPGEVQARSDTLILVSIKDSIHKAALVSIPRDTRIVFQGSNRKINMVNQLKGPQDLCREVGKLLNTDVAYYMLTNFHGFEEIIDALGGVSMDVDIRLQSYSSGVFLEKGYQQLTGKEALAYVRFRNNPDMDIGRIQRQQKLLEALAQQVMQKETLPRLPQLIPKVRQSVATNLSAGDMLLLTRTAMEFNQDSIVTQTLPGYHYFAPASGASFWEADRRVSTELLEGLFQGHQYETNLPAPPGVNSW
ncbi:MAG TPA: LCP family protein [Syntrophomonadaceae bacterium]|nr:LCP family protein [Syntrophomonadaceae bacterium]